jgi:hypothetical protein
MAGDIDSGDDLDVPAADAEAKPAPAAVFMEEVWKASVPGKTRRKLQKEGSGFALLLHVPDATWVQLLGQLLPRYLPGPHYKTYVEAPRSAAPHHQDPSIVRILSRGERLVVISHDPAGLVPSIVRRAADGIVMIGTPPVDAVRTTIRRITGRVVRGLKAADFAGLDIDLLLSCLRPEEKPAEIIGRLRELTSAPTIGELSALDVPRLDQLPLTDAVHEWSDVLLHDLAAVKSGELDPSALVYAALEGPPGTGKTLICRSLAATAGWNFISSSVGTWFTVGDGALGGVARNVKGFVDSVLKAEPAIGFLDELDAIPNRATMDPRGLDWWAPVVTLILTEIDRLRASGRKVVLLGATNFYDRLDAALIRPGRLQQRVSVLAPSTEQEVLAVFGHYLGGDLPAAELTKLARVAIGATPAAIEGWVKSARASARIAGRPLTAGDLLDQMAPADDRSPADLRTAALHELGHAIVAADLGHAVNRISIVSGADSGGHTSMRLVSVVPTLAQLHDLVTVILGGRAADVEVGPGAHSGAESDLAKATDLLLAARQRQGLGDTLAALPPVMSPALMRDVDGDLKRLLDRARAIVRGYRRELLRLADQLLVERIMSGEVVLAAMQSPSLHRRDPAPDVSDQAESVEEPSLHGSR